MDKITIFTPTYNRAYLLPKLYDSLKKQSNKNFKWLIIDDGSTDNTQELVDFFISENVISIQYKYKINEGLNKAYNYAVKITDTEIFFRVDSDDSITENAVEVIYSNWGKIETRKDISGLVFLSKFSNGKIVGLHPFGGEKECTFFEYRSRYKAKGDRAEIMKTSVLKDFPFPSYGKEKFCPEGLMWNRISKEYKALYIPETIYIREYMNDSITSTVVSTLKKNAKGASQYYLELLEMHPSFLYFCKNSLLFWRYAFFNKEGLFRNLCSIPFFSRFFIFPGIILVIYDLIKGR